MFNESKIVTSVYNTGFEGSLNKDLINKVKFDEIDGESIDLLKEPTYNNIMKVAVDNSDAIIKGSYELPEELNTYLDGLENPVLDFKEKDEFAEAYTNFYNESVLG